VKKEKAEGHGVRGAGARRKGIVHRRQGAHGRRAAPGTWDEPAARRDERDAEGGSMTAAAALTLTRARGNAAST
jgi:hypothetical protein